MDEGFSRDGRLGDDEGIAGGLEGQSKQSNGLYGVQITACISLSFGQLCG